MITAFVGDNKLILILSYLILQTICFMCDTFLTKFTSHRRKFGHIKISLHGFWFDFAVQF